MSQTTVIAVVASLALAVCLIQILSIYLDKNELLQMRNDALQRTTATLEGKTKTMPRLQSLLAGMSTQGASGEIVQKTLVSLTTRGSIFNKRVSPTKSALRYDSELAMLIDITNLGMRAGMSFDQAFELSLRHFPGELATLCQAKLDIWQRGLISRDQGLHDLEEQVQTVLFSRFVALVLRALRYGAPMTVLLAALSEDARREIKAMREEEVAKAPVKMLIPTGALILPAMLLLVLGPIMLDMIKKM
ncbi:MAG: type II secretion system F family protein [Coriobacteriia bacterium]|nr:type II secretion system F family protein [Coriobacteriia bacterium]